MDRGLWTARFFKGIYTFQAVLSKSSYVALSTLPYLEKQLSGNPP